MRVKPIVEGYGELYAVPTLIRKICVAENLYTADVRSPVRAHRSDFENEAAFKKLLALARLDTPDAILIVFDGDGKCPVTLSDILQPWLSEATPIPCEVVVAHQEYEAWFLAAIKSLRGKHGIREEAVVSMDPESFGDAKGVVSSLMEAGLTYAPTADQDALTELIDLDEASQGSRSFRRVLKAVKTLIDAYIVA